MKVSILGVLVGGFADVVTSFLVTMPLSAYLVFQRKASSGRVAIANNTTYGRMNAHPAIWLVEMILSLFCSAFGGYVAAAIAGREERLNGTLSCYLCISLGLVVLSFGLVKDPIWLQVIFLVLSPAMAFIGGDIRLRQRTRRARFAAV